ncbi:MAG: pilus assembly protein PilP [Gammaproteobacteria bacterium]|nr:pilus assembly protein PilP [Gammaproteobacteria bacterium]MCF6229358.1 pilus assembly protein PilP [Gammaproteobacteria bacterium]
MESVKARPAGSVEPLRDPVEYETYEYQSDSRRDPFKPSFTLNKVAPTKNGSSSGGPNLDRERNQLESFPIDTLRYIGNLQRGAVSWGLIKTPDGEIVRVRLGDYMGQDYGRVTLVDSDKIELLELIPDGMGGWEERAVSLVLNG